MPFKVIDRQRFGSDFPTGSKKRQFLGSLAPECIFSSFAYPKDTSLCYDASFKPSTIKIGSGVRPVDVSKKKREGMAKKMR
jgi:hypothetical protein